MENNRVPLPVAAKELGPENADRREDVLEHMLEQEYITQAEFDEAMGDNV
ncbi:MAG: hypothetical protein HFH67_11390, partial [Lachnospiraceae bacterium]|nr:hypothetical protein [Lachnospiraceae bacterium]